MYNFVEVMLLIGSLIENLTLENLTRKILNKNTMATLTTRSKFNLRSLLQTFTCSKSTIETQQMVLVGC